MKTTKKQLAIDSLMAKNNSEFDNFKSLIIVKYGLSVAIWDGKSHKPTYHYRFRTESERAEFIERKKTAQLKNLREVEEILKRCDEEKKQFVPGSILVSSWGYEQTNIDFYEILERKGDFVTIQEIGSKRNYSTISGYEYNDRGSCIADISVKKGLPFRKKISNRASLNLESYKHCGIWDKTPMSWSSYA